MPSLASSPSEQGSPAHTLNDHSTSSADPSADPRVVTEPSSNSSSLEAPSTNQHRQLSTRTQRIIRIPDRLYPERQPPSGSLSLEIYQQVCFVKGARRKLHLKPVRPQKIWKAAAAYFRERVDLRILRMRESLNLFQSSGTGDLRAWSQLEQTRIVNARCLDLEWVAQLLERQAQKARSGKIYQGRLECAVVEIFSSWRGLPAVSLNQQEASSSQRSVHLECARCCHKFVEMVRSRTLLLLGSC